MIWITLILAVMVPCEQPRIRKDFRRLTTQEWKDYSYAVYKLKLSGKITAYAKQHWDMYDLIHSGKETKTNFLTWHRAFVWDYESSLRNITGKPITIPFVDWGYEADRYSGTIEKSMAFTGYYYGEEKNGCLDGNIYNSFSLRPDMSAFLGRSCVFNQFNPNYKIGGWSTIDSMIFANREYEAFAKEVEQGLHFNIHSRIGGIMIRKISPMNPIFWAHHSFIDLVLTTWQYTHNQWQDLPANYARRSFNILDNTYNHEELFRMTNTCATYERYSGFSNSNQNNIQKRSHPDKYEKPKFTHTNDTSIQDYNKLVTNYYNDVKSLFINNQSEDLAFKKSIEFYGTNSFIPIISYINNEALDLFNINKIQYKAMTTKRNMRALKIAKLMNIPITIDNITTIDYTSVSNQLNTITNLFKPTPLHPNSSAIPSDSMMSSSSSTSVSFLLVLLSTSWFK